MIYRMEQNCYESTTPKTKLIPVTQIKDETQKREKNIKTKERSLMV